MTATAPKAIEPSPVSKLTVVLTGLGGVAAAAYVSAFNPNVKRLFPPCPLHQATGIWCPGCGLTRGTHALLRGDILAALGYNIFTPLVLGALAYWWVNGALMAFTTRRLPKLIQRQQPAAIAVVVAAIAFMIARNIPGPLAALAP
jgi:Protein of unknown function (DUF2752)